MSAAPASATRSSWSATIASTRGRSRSTAAGVNALLTSARSLVWSGGSANNIEGAASPPAFPMLKPVGLQAKD